MFSQASIILSTGCVCGRHPPWAHPPRQTPPPPAQCMLGYTPLPSVCWDTPPPPAATAADVTHPTVMHSCMELKLVRFNLLGKETRYTKEANRLYAELLRTTRRQRRMTWGWHRLSVNSCETFTLIVSSARRPHVVPSEISPPKTFPFKEHSCLQQLC